VAETGFINQDFTYSFFLSVKKRFNKSLIVIFGYRNVSAFMTIPRAVCLSI